MPQVLAKELEKVQAELLNSRLSYLDLAEGAATALAAAAEKASAARLLNGLDYIKLAMTSQDALKAAHKALANAEEKSSAQKQSLNSASLFAKAVTQKNGPALFAAAKPSKAEDDNNFTPAPAA